MSTRKVHQAPAFTRISNADGIRKIVLEIQKIHPPFEVSLEKHGALARGRIRHWDVTKKLFTVRWNAIDDSFVSASGERTGLRSFFKVKLFTTQLIFRTELIRRLPDGEFQYRIPQDFFQSQLRKSLRLPMPEGSAQIVCKQGVFAVLDLSSSGARIAISKKHSARLHQLDSCVLILGRNQLSSPEFEVVLTHRNEDSAGGRFRGLNEPVHIAIKQFLIETLHLLVKGTPS